MNQPISLTITEQIAILKIDRSEARNALNWEMQQQFADAVQHCAQNAEVRVLIVTGSADIFVAGGDIKDQHDNFDAKTGLRLKSIMSDALIALTEMPKPVIAAINGNAYGGGSEIITACDLRVMQAGAKLYFVQAKMGLTTGWGGTPRLVRLIGVSQAMELLLTTKGITAETAHQIGLINQVVAADENVIDVSIALAKRLAALPSSSVGALKKLVYTSASSTLKEAYEAETQLFVEQWQHPNHIEAVNAFLEKRPPHFT